ncbi:MAG: hypothetical protein LH480_04470 [Rubrivivax sp.]|nr:hypothetical protein [Rubrivivax sp.]
MNLQPCFHHSRHHHLPQPGAARRGLLGLMLLPTLGLLAACATRAPIGASTPTTSPGNPPGAPGAPPSAAANPTRDQAALKTELQWLQQWFKDTPVQIVLTADALNVEVPREFAFDTARAQIKPPLAAVLDKVAQSLRRLPQARLELVAAPGDVSVASATASASPAAALALQRATQVRRHLLSRGVAAAQLGTPSANTAAAVQLRLALAAP